MYTHHGHAALIFLPLFIILWYSSLYSHEWCSGMCNWHLSLLFVVYLFPYLFFNLLLSLPNGSEFSTIFSSALKRTLFLSEFNTTVTFEAQRPILIIEQKLETSTWFPISAVHVLIFLLPPHKWEICGVETPERNFLALRVL